MDHSTRVKKTQDEHSTHDHLPTQVNSKRASRSKPWMGGRWESERGTWSITWTGNSSNYWTLRSRSCRDRPRWIMSRQGSLQDLCRVRSSKPSTTGLLVHFLPFRRLSKTSMANRTSSKPCTNQPKDRCRWSCKLRRSRSPKRTLKWSRKAMCLTSTKWATPMGSRQWQN